MAGLFRNGKIVVGKVNVEGSTIETLCVEVERTTNRKQDKESEIVLYPLLDANNKYIFESITTAIKAGLKRKYIEQEIKKYITNKDNYDYTEEMRKKVTKEEHNSYDLIEITIFSAKTLDELANIYWKLEKQGLIDRYKNKILSRVNKINIDSPFFYAEFNKYQDDWVDESSCNCFTLYMYKVNLILQKYSEVEYDAKIDFDGILVKKKDYLESLLYNFMEQWLNYGALYSLDEKDYERFCSVYSRFEYASYSSYAMAILYLSLKNCIEKNSSFISKNIKEIVLIYDKKVRNKIDEIDIPSLSFNHSYMQALETNNCIHYAKAFFQVKNNEEKHKLKSLEEKIKNSFFNIDECLLLQLCFFEKHKTTRDCEVNIIALITLLDNVNLKNNPNFKRLHLLFYQYILYYTDGYEKDKSSKVLKKIKELYDNNYCKYDEEVKNEYQHIMR